MITESKVAERTPSGRGGQYPSEPGVEAETYERMAAVFAALADPTRARIVHLLLVADRCTADLARIVGVTEPAVSQHLRILRELGLARSRRQGRFVYYRLDDDHVAGLVESSLAHLGHPRRESDAGAGGERNGG